MNVKEFSNYDKACEFRDKVGGQVEWSSYKGKSLWYVWYEKHEMQKANIIWIKCKNTFAYIIIMVKEKECGDYVITDYCLWNGVIMRTLYHAKY